MRAVEIGRLAACAAVLSGGTLTGCVGAPGTGSSGGARGGDAPQRASEPPRQIDASTPLAEPTPQVRPVEVPPAPWAPDWFREGPGRHNGAASGSGVATADNLLDARRDAVERAERYISGAERTAVERTVTRRLDDGTFRVWVRMVADEG